MRFTPAFPAPGLAHVLSGAKASGPKPADLKMKSINSSFIVLVRRRFKFSVQNSGVSARDFVANSRRNLPRLESE
jgi:hypothetical protein